MARSRLSKYVLYRYCGEREGVGFTASFKPVLVRFRRAGDMGAVREGAWYFVLKKPVKSRLLVGPQDLEPASVPDLLELGRRMRIRWFRIVRGRGSHGLRVCNLRNLPYADAVALLALGPGGVIRFSVIPWHRAVGMRGKAVYARTPRRGCLFAVVATVWQSL